ncbi:Dpy-30 motif [Trinorchestia longiramus]|nr:Dpy-30 motif [Trinorchestia longiramus]
MSDFPSRPLEAEKAKPSADQIAELPKTPTDQEADAPKTPTDQETEHPKTPTDQEAEPPKTPTDLGNEGTSTQYPNVWTDEGEYLAKALGDALTKSLAEVNAARPRDPVSHLALMLYSQLLDPAVPHRAKREPSRENSAYDSGHTTRSNSTIPMQTVFTNEGNNNGSNGNDSSGNSGNENGNKNGGRKRHVRDRNGRNALHLAAEKHHAPSVFLQLVQAAGVRLVAERDASYRTPKDIAVHNQQQDNAREIDSFVCSLAAAGNTDDLRYLMLQGYDHLLTAEDEQAVNIVKVAEKNKQKKAIEQLQDAAFHEERREWLNRAIIVGSLPHVQYIVDSPDLIIGRDTKGRLPLHLATLLERADIMSYLVSKAPVTLAVGDNLGRTPLHYAMAVKKIEDVAPILVQAGAKRNIKDLRGKMPSYYYMKRDDMMQMLQEVYDEQEA